MKFFNRSVRCCLVSFILVVGLVEGADQSKFKVGVLNPILSDFVKQVGGEQVDVIEIMKPGEDPHSFSPSPDELKALSQSQIIFAMGGGLEPYLKDLKNVLGKRIEIVEIYPVLPKPSDKSFFSSLSKSGNQITDPHWWHSIPCSRRAVRHITDYLGEKDNVNRVLYWKNYSAYLSRLMDLDEWVRLEISTIKKGYRKIILSHDSMSYLSWEYGLTILSVQGLNLEQKPKPDYLKQLIEVIRSDNFVGVFPEVVANSKLLQNLSRETGLVRGLPLFVDTLDPKFPSYENMMRYNINSIVSTLSSYKDND